MNCAAGRHENMVGLGRRRDRRSDAVFLPICYRTENRMNAHSPLNPHTLRIGPVLVPVLVLQDGGALGAYQALHEHELVPDWIVGTSTGAIR